ncbi:methyltransferase domain-containing protein [Colletotrichum graminicola]|uniref:Methyltransferase domain-containing protein n=1 Tax=Colletotrichum graminicola (strain M1.001 / M2 / FGSC 10212) TaxID=645133 RepID=E3Q2S5_COLGM|nr:methyltransferase domain-containing protein [Colletotrichum graminicola M1.001]EFQ24904.1 methyltransferase domain-containing protein [Colletotrichum graminicola M1.001]WDK15558.1 methyltransferase domain-containing protein [Colletotrichum graminicola]
MAEPTTKEETVPPAGSGTASPSQPTTASPAVPDPPENANEAEVIEHDDVDNASETASTVDDRWSTYTGSLTSSVFDYPTEHGRRYHAFRSGSYWGPNDETEMERLDFNHMLIVKVIGNKLYLAPLDKNKIHRILDVGTGTGVCAIQMGDEFPNAQIIGNDLSPIQPTWVPPNVKFEVDDVESPWLIAEKYDFIFCRYMAGSLGDWPKLMRRVFRNTNPGGWVEFQDYNLRWKSDDGSLTEKHFTNEAVNNFLEACKLVNREPAPGPKLEGWVKDAGFVNITHQKFKIPVGDWPKDPHYKECGLINLMQTLEGLEGFTLRMFTSVLGWTKEEVIVLLAEVRRELKTRTFHAYFDFHVVYAQKPEVEEE